MPHAVITLSDQVLAVQRAAVNWRGHVSNIRGNPKRAAEFASQEAFPDQLDAAAHTLEWLEQNKGLMRAVARATPEQSLAALRALGFNADAATGEILEPEPALL